ERGLLELEPRGAQIDSVVEQIAKRRDARPWVFHENAGIKAAAPAGSDQPHSDGRVSLRPAHGLRLDDHPASDSRGGLHEMAPRRLEGGEVHGNLLWMFIIAHRRPGQGAPGAG